MSDEKVDKVEKKPEAEKPKAEPKPKVEKPKVETKAGPTEKSETRAVVDAPKRTRKTKKAEK